MKQEKPKVKKLKKKKTHTILAYCFTDSLCSHVYTPIARYFTVVSFNFASFSQTEIIIHTQ